MRACVCGVRACVCVNVACVCVYVFLRVVSVTAYVRMCTCACFSVCWPRGVTRNTAVVEGFPHSL